MSVECFETLFRLASVQPRLDHNQRNWDAAGRALQRVLSKLPIDSCGLLQNANGPLYQLLVLHAHVDHEVSIDITKARHGARGQHIQDHLLGRARLHAG